MNSCTLTSNSVPNYASAAGGAAAGSWLNNCTLTGNSAYSGGGANASRLDNCTVTGNSAWDGGGTYSGAILDSQSLPLQINNNPNANFSH